MKGMRERKRQERHDAIIDAAMALFRSQGYERTKMEDIAARADISPPTLYRYFSRKTELLIALFWKERARNAAALDEFHEKSASMDAVSAVAGLLYLNNSGIRSKGERKLWREAAAALMRMHDEANDEFRAIKQYFERHIERMLARLHRDGLITRQTPLPAMVDVLYAIAAENYYRMIENEFKTAADEKSAMDQQVGLVLKGWLTKKSATRFVEEPLPVK
jgi:AcrR family transcriptional regulator